MPRPKSMIYNISVTIAGRGHYCRQSKDHRIEKGMSRLTVKSDGNEHHYCLACAKSFLEKDIDRLRSILTKINNLPTSDKK